MSVLTALTTVVAVAYFLFCVVEGQSNFEMVELAMHNQYRWMHGVQLLTIDPVLKSKAESYAMTLASNGGGCSLTHSPQERGIGENLYYTTGMYSPGSASQTWYAEINNYNYNDPKYVGSPPEGQNGHFTALVWDNTNLVGFGMASNGRCTYIVANYKPWGNVNVFPDSPKARQALTDHVKPLCSSTPSRPECSGG